MRGDWDERARENAFYYVATGHRDWSEEQFFRSGQQTLEELVLSDIANICRGRDPKKLCVLEIGCGVGRVTRALAEVFGAVVGVDVSPVMVAKAKTYLSSCDNVSFFVNNGKDLRMLGDGRFDFALSHLTFQHVPSKAIIESYIAETSRLLRPGALFKFDVQGYGALESGDRTWISRARTLVARTRQLLRPLALFKFYLWYGSLQSPGDNTWFGQPFSKEELTRIADACGFRYRYSLGEGEQMFCQWFFKKGPPTFRADPNPAQACGSGRYRTVLSWEAPTVDRVEIRIGSADGTLFARDSFWGSTEIELPGIEALKCFLLDASNHQVLGTTVIESGHVSA